MIENLAETIVRATLSKDSSELEGIYHKWDDTMKSLVLNNPNLSEEFLINIFNTWDLNTKMRVIKNPNSPKYLIDKLSDNERELLKYMK